MQKSVFIVFQFVNVKEVANRLKEKPDSTPVVVVRLRKVEVDIKELLLRKLKVRAGKSQCWRCGPRSCVDCIAATREQAPQDDFSFTS